MNLWTDDDVPTELSGLANCSASIISNKAESSKYDESIWLNPVNLFNVRNPIPIPMCLLSADTPIAS